jgi:hypothetical protein
LVETSAEPESRHQPVNAQAACLVVHPESHFEFFVPFRGESKYGF